jgi:hypothetical protein
MLSHALSAAKGLAEDPIELCGPPRPGHCAQAAPFDTVPHYVRNLLRMLSCGRPVTPGSAGGTSMLSSAERVWKRAGAPIQTSEVLETSEVPRPAYRRRGGRLTRTPASVATVNRPASCAPCFSRTVLNTRARLVGLSSRSRRRRTPEWGRIARKTRSPKSLSLVTSTRSSAAARWRMSESLAPGIAWWTARTSCPPSRSRSTTARPADSSTRKRTDDCT